MICPTPLWCVYTDPGTLSNKLECALGIPGLAAGATLYGSLPQRALVGGGKYHSVCFFKFAAVVPVCK